MRKKHWWRRWMSRGKYTITWWRIISRKSLLLLNRRQLQYRSLKCLKFSNADEFRIFFRKPFKIWFLPFFTNCLSYRDEYLNIRFLWIKRSVNDISIFISLFQAIKQWYKHIQNSYFQKTKFTFLWNTNEMPFVSYTFIGIIVITQTIFSNGISLLGYVGKTIS